MSTSEDERKAMLEKIRADMAASRQKIQQMKEKKARGTIVLNTTPKSEETKANETKKFQETASLVEKLRAEREAKKQQALNSTEPSSSSSDEGSPTTKKKVVLVRKNADGTEERVIKEIDTNELSDDGKSLRVKKLAASDTRQRAPSISSGRMRMPSIDQGRNRGPSIDQGRMRMPSIDQGRNRGPSIDQGRMRMPSIDKGDARNRTTSIDIGNKRKIPQRNPIATTTSSGSANDGKLQTGGKIRSLQDMQSAIAKAGETKKKAERQGKLEQIKRAQREARKNEMTKEERRAYRQSKRMTVEMKQNESRVKIDKQIGGFMMMMQKLEADWQRGEEERIKSVQDMAEQRKLMEKVGTQMEFLTNTLSDLSARMDHMKLMLDKLVDSAPKSVKKEDKWNTDLKAFQEKFWKMRHQAYISTAKYKKMMEEQAIEDAEQNKSSGQIPAAPNAPPVPVPPPAGGGGAVSNPITNLLASIRQGTSLKKLDPKQIEEEKQQRKGNWRQSVALLQGLQDTLKDALDQRHLSLFSDEESDEEWDSDEEEDWED